MSSVEVNPTNDTFKTFAFWLAALFIITLGAHLWIVWLYGSSIPLWDQWYEAAFFKSWIAGTWKWADFFAGNNEHRVFLTRVLDVGLIEMNGRWEPLLQMTVNAFIHASFACCLAFCLWHFFGRRNGWLVCSLLIPFFALPYGGENATWGFNSQQYFVNLFGLGAIAGLGFGKTGSRGWWAGLAAAFIGLFTMANGLLAPLAIAGLAVLRMLKGRRINQAEVITLAACLVIFAVGVDLNVTKQEDHSFQAHSFADFAKALTRNMSWPFYNAPLMPCFIVLPLVLLLAFYFRPNFQQLRTAELLLVLGLWSVLQSIVLSYGRANYGGNFPVGRYMDWLSILVIASVFAAVLLAQMQERHAWRNGVLALIFFVVIFCGLCRISEIVVEGLLAHTRMINLVAAERIQRLTMTGSESEFLENPTVPPDPKLVLSVLEDPQLQTILPLACVTPSAASKEWLMPSAQWLIRHGIFVLSFGLVFFVALCWREGVPPVWGKTARSPVALVSLLIALMALAFIFTKRNVSRESVEYGLQEQIAASFKAAGNSVRAAIHEQKAEALKQFAN